MKNMALILIFLAAGILIINVSGISAQANFSTLKCDIIMEHPAAGRSEGKLFMKGELSRTELDTAGMPTITIVDGKNAYMYLPQQNTAMLVSLSEAKAQVPSIGDYRQNCDYLGEETVGSSNCSVYECSKDGAAVKIWIGKEIEFPLKASGSGATTYYRNIQTNIPLDDSLFYLPAGVQIQDMSTLLDGMQGLLKGLNR